VANDLSENPVEYDTGSGRQIMWGRKTYYLGPMTHHYLGNGRPTR